MSSHHIVREKQEPALLILELEHFDADWLGQLLEWSPTVIATPATVWPLLAQDIHVDWLLTEEGSNPTTQNDIQLIPSAAGAWPQAALEQLIAKGYPAVNVVADAFDMDAYTPYWEKINIVIYCGQQKIYAVKSGFEKWKPAGALIKVLNQSDELVAENLKRLSEQAFEVQADGFIKLTFTQPLLIISEQL